MAAPYQKFNIMGTYTKPASGATEAGQISDNAGMSDKDKAVPTIDGALNKEVGSFTADVYDNLPPILADCCATLSDHTEREVFLIGSLAVLSGILPNVHGFYDQQYYKPHLFCFVIANYGSGKGSLKLAYQLGKQIHAMQKERSAQNIADWKQEASEAAQSKPPQPQPPHPGNKMTFIPANNSKSGLIELMEQNDGKGILFETEGDTLADALKTEHGNFSDILRKSFHHEKIAFYRRTDHELKEIENPALAVILSATPDQYAKLIPTPCNGLFSRFMHFCPEPNKDFRDVFDASRQKYPAHFDAAGEKFKAIFEVLESLETPIEYALSTPQRKPFLEYFSDLKSEFFEYVSPDMEGTSHRLALIAFRISMILTAVRSFEEGDFSAKIHCAQIDFDNTMRIMEVLKRHTLQVFHRLPKPAERAEYTAMKNELSEKAGQIAQAHVLLKQGKSYGQIAKIVLGDEKFKQKVHYWLNAKK